MSEKEEKQRVTILVNPKILERWDKLADEVCSGNRTALIHNAVRIYELFIANQLNGDQTQSIETQLEQIKLLIEGLHERANLLNKKEKEIDDEFKKIDTTEIKDFDIVAKRILDLLEGWGSLPESTIQTHLNYPGWIVWTVLKKLKTMKKVKVERGEWKLYAK